MRVPFETLSVGVCCWRRLPPRTFRLPRLVNEFRAWRGALVLGDPAAAEGWHRVLNVELIGVLVVLAIGIAAFYVLRPKAKAAQ